MLIYSNTDYVPVEQADTACHNNVCLSKIKTYWLNVFFTTWEQVVQVNLKDTWIHNVKSYRTNIYKNND